MSDKMTDEEAIKYIQIFKGMYLPCHHVAMDYAITAIEERAKLKEDVEQSKKVWKSILEDIEGCSKLVKENTSLKELLKELEWSGFHEELCVSICPCCRFSEKYGHTKDCKLNQLLKGGK